MKTFCRRLIWPAITGIAALILLCVFGVLIGTVNASYYALAEGVYQQNHDIGPLSSEQVSNSMALIEILFLCVVLFSAGMASVILARPKSEGSQDWRVSLVPGGIVAAGIGAYIFLNWIQNVQLYMSGGTLNGRPFEPPILPIILLIMVVATIICIVPALLGGWLASRQSMTKKEEDE